MARPCSTIGPSIRAWRGPLVPTLFSPLASWTTITMAGWMSSLPGGAVIDLEARKLAGDRYPLGLPKGLLHNARDGRFEDATAGASRTFPLLEVSRGVARSEEHTSELQSLAYLVCRLLLEKKKKKN